MVESRRSVVGGLLQESGVDYIVNQSAYGREQDLGATLFSNEAVITRCF
jgi:hypothetical protein